MSWQPERVYRPDDTPDAFPDYVLLCVKVLPGVDRAALVRPWMGDHTGLVLIENGLDIERELTDAYPQHPLVSCLAFIAVSRTGPGEVHHQAYGQLVMGNFPAGFDEHCRRLSGLFREGGIEVNDSEAVVGSAGESVSGMRRSILSACCAMGPIRYRFLMPPVAKTWSVP